MSIDASQLRELAVDLERAAQRKPAEVFKVVSRGALEIKKVLQAEAKGVSHAPAMPGDISYDAKIRPGSIEAEIGPTTGDVGSLALLYFGNSKAAPRLKDPIFALEREAKVVEEHIGKLVQDIL